MCDDRYPGYFQNVAIFQANPPTYLYQYVHHDGQTHRHLHLHTSSQLAHQHLHKLSFSVGIVHGLAGSIHTVASSLLFLIIFSIGCIAGMVLAAGILSLPFSKKLQSFARVQQILEVVSCTVCVLLGARIMLVNWFN